MGHTRSRRGARSAQQTFMYHKVISLVARQFLMPPTFTSRINVNFSGAGQRIYSDTPLPSGKKGLKQIEAVIELRNMLLKGKNYSMYGLVIAQTLGY